MYQAALGGYDLVFTDAPVYYEPGFTIMYPLELEVPQCDIYYILIRKRSDSGGVIFDTLSISNMSISVKDATNGEDIPAYLTATLTNTFWDDDPAFTPIVLVVENNLSVGNATTRVVSLDISISDNNDNTFINLRTSIVDTGRFFYFIPLSTNELSGRNKNTAVGTQYYLSVGASGDRYLLFSPYSFFSEVEKGSDGISFSYPVGSIFYKRQKSYNDEDFDFSILSSSHAFVPDNISLINIPGYRKVAALHVDANMHSELSHITTNAFVDIESVGTLSGVTDTFRVNLTR